MSHQSRKKALRDFSKRYRRSHTFLRRSDVKVEVEELFALQPFKSLAHCPKCYIRSPRKDPVWHRHIPQHLLDLLSSYMSVYKGSPRSLSSLKQHQHHNLSYKRRLPAMSAAPVMSSPTVSFTSQIMPVNSKPIGN